MRKFILSAIIIFSFAGYAVFANRLGSGNTLAVPLPLSARTSPPGIPAIATAPAPIPIADNPPVAAMPQTPAPKPKPTRAPAPVLSPAPKLKGQYIDGTYTGNSADAYYGYIQVQVTIAGGKISNVAFLDYPQDRGTSREINGQAMPYLKQEAIIAQSANVDIVSGATDSSLAFRQSLASALAQAKS